MRVAEAFPENTQIAFFAPSALYALGKVRGVFQDR